MRIDLDSLARSVLRPERAALARASAAATGVQDAREAWEVLAARGVLPLAWAAGDGRRFFVEVTGPCPSCDGTGAWWDGDGNAGCNDCGLTGQAWRRQPYPARVAHAVAIASDPAGVASAETLARELSARLGPWGFERSDSVVWWGGGDRAPSKVHRWGPLWHALNAATGDVRGADAAHDQLMRQVPADAAHLGFDLYCALMWQQASDRGQPVPSSALHAGLMPAQVAGRRFAELPDPFSIVLDIWRTGYQPLGGVFGPEIELAAPPA